MSEEVPDGQSLNEDADFLGSEEVEKEPDLEDQEEATEPEAPETEEEVPSEEEQEEGSEEEPKKSVEDSKLDQVKALTEQVSKYEEIFATPEDAKVASEKSILLDNLDQAVMSGRADVLLQVIGKANSESFVNFSKNFLPSLEKLSRSTYIEVTAPVIRRVLRASLAAASAKNDDNLFNGIKHLSNFLFESAEVPDEPEAPKPNPDQIKFQREKAEFFRGQDDQYKGQIANFIVTESDKLITDGLDPNGNMTDRMKKTVLDDTRDAVARAIESDKVFQNKMTSLVNKAIQNGRKKEDAIAIYRFYMARFKALMPAARSEARKAILPTKTKVTAAPSRNVRTTGQGQAPRSGDGSTGGKKVDWSKTSDADFLADKVTYR